MKTNRCSILAASISLCLLSGPAFSAGFGIAESSGSSMGNAFAGAAAGGMGDATTVWYNPAGMEQLGDQAQLSKALHIVSSTLDYTDKGSSGKLGMVTGINDDGGGASVIPNLYYVKPIGHNMHFGIGINGPFGAEVNYDNAWYGRYQATDTSMLSVNINPSLSYRVSDRLSLGGGLNAQYVEVKLGSAIQSGVACLNAGIAAGSSALISACNAAYPTISGAADDSRAVVEGDGIAYGYNLGLLFEPSKRTRLGLSYRSGIQHDVKGDIDYTLNDKMPAAMAANLKDEAVHASVKVPASASLSVAYDASERLELLADLTWTQWSNFQNLTIVSDATGKPITNVHENWEDVFRISVGGNYKYSDKLVLRAGLAFDEEPIPSPKYRTPRIPGDDRTWLSVGAGYQLNKKLSMDVGYSHIIVDDTPIDHTDENGYNVKGLYDSNVDILSAQINYRF